MAKPQMWPTQVDVHEGSNAKELHCLLCEVAKPLRELEEQLFVTLQDLNVASEA